LGTAADLLTTCLKSKEFWGNLKRNHRALLLKYSIGEKVSYEFKKDIDQLQN